MRRILPAPLLSAALFVMWLVLNPHASATTLVVAGAVGIAIPLLTSSLRPVPFRFRGVRTAVALLATVVGDAFVSNVEVARTIWRPRGQPRSAFVRVPLELRDPNGLAMLAVITTLVPGTVWTALAADRSSLLLHVFDVGDEAGFVAHYKARYERPLIAMFG